MLLTIKLSLNVHLIHIWATLISYLDLFFWEGFQVDAVRIWIEKFAPIQTQEHQWSQLEKACSRSISSLLLMFLPWSSSRHLLLSLGSSNTLLSEKWPSSCTGWHSITDLSVACEAEWVSVLEKPPLLCSPFDCLFMMCPNGPVGRETNIASRRTDYAWSQERAFFSAHVPSNCIV